MNTESEATQETPTPPLPKCGVVMPISSIDDCDESHWSDVREILYEAIETAGFDPNLVSDADDVGVIQKRIIQNLYDNPIVVCDISCKNPNVMFELGIRLAFDKPTIVVKDRSTSFSFDTSPVEHLLYPRDLRFSQIVDFKAELAKKIKATHSAATKDPENYTTFLKHFGTFTVAKLDSKEVSGNELILEEIRQLKSSVRNRAIRLDEPVLSERMLDTSDDGMREFATIFPGILREHLKEIGLSRKSEIRKSKDEILEGLRRHPAGPDHFRSSRHFRDAMSTLFDAMYS